MGTDIHGWIEIKSCMGGEWTGLIKIDLLLSRDYTLFGFLFGMPNRNNLKPIASGRGLPTDISWETTKDLLGWVEEYGCEPLYPTWLNWQEIKEIDWDKDEEESNSRIKRYRKTETNELKVDGSNSENSFDKETLKKLKEGETIETSEFVYKFEKIRRKDALPSAQMLLNWLEKVSEDFKNYDIRLIVWFDN